MEKILTDREEEIIADVMKILDCGDKRAIRDIEMHSSFIVRMLEDNSYDELEKFNAKLKRLEYRARGLKLVKGSKQKYKKSETEQHDRGAVAFFGSPYAP